MTAKNFLTAGGIVALFFGIVLIFAQDTFAKMVLTDHSLSVNARAFITNFGIVLAGVGIGTLVARNSIPSAARRGFVIQFTVACLLLACYDTYGIIHGVNSAGEWGVVAIVALLGLWGLFLLFKERASAL